MFNDYCNDSVLLMIHSLQIQECYHILDRFVTILSLVADAKEECVLIC